MLSERYKLDEVEFPDTPFPLMESCVLLGKRGSESHGTYIAPTTPDAFDDRDIMGVCVPPLDYLLGLKSWEGKDAIKGCWDTVLYSLKKFVGLLVKQNPNVVGLLWLRPEDYLYLSEAGEMLLRARGIFRAKGPAYRSFMGYANDQLNKMTTHQPYEGYMGAKRKALVDKFGYDVKNACHLIRLLYTGEEYLRTGEMRVFRPGKERTTLMDIKTGKWPLAEVKEYAKDLFHACTEAYKISPLPEAIDYEEANEVTTVLTKLQLGLRLY